MFCIQCHLVVKLFIDVSNVEPAFSDLNKAYPLNDQIYLLYNWFEYQTYILLRFEVKSILKSFFIDLKMHTSYIYNQSDVHVYITLLYVFVPIM